MSYKKDIVDCLVEALEVTIILGVLAGIIYVGSLFGIVGMGLTIAFSIVFIGKYYID